MAVNKTELKNLINSLITNRTYRDVKERSLKGYYSASDINRVINTVAKLRLYMIENGYSPAPINALPEFSDTSIPTYNYMQKYLNNISILRNAVVNLPSATPKVPPDMDLLTYQDANDIEKILVYIYQTVSG